MSVLEAGPELADVVDPESDARVTARKGLLSRHPRLGVVLIGLLFIIPICAMVATVLILIAFQVSGA